MDNLGRLRTEWGDRLRLFACSYVHSMDVAEDLVQDVFLKILEQNVDLSEYRSLESFMYTILRNKCLDYIKHKVVVTNHVQNIADLNYLRANQYALEDESIKFIVDNEKRKILKDAINSLPSGTRDIFVMNKLKGKTHKEISEATGLTSRQIQYQIYKAVSMLKEKMKEFYILLLFYGLFFKDFFIF
ncbi:MAG: RNA polymerase sigma-70 factor [Bacteroidales bacterium]|nr:RNA polymerase sigma-70 factor [Bacteroidales bacterium]